jgi:hypothetical protein
VWQLAVHSGDARYLHPDERLKIAERYFALDNYNYEAKITRALGDDFEQAIGMPDEVPKHNWWIESANRMHAMESSLSNTIKELTNQQGFWPKD